MRLALDDVSLVRVYYSQQFAGQPVEPSTQTRAVFLPHWSSVNSVWHFEDPQSTIVDYMWAVGQDMKTFHSIGFLYMNLILVGFLELLLLTKTLTNSTPVLMFSVLFDIS